MEVLSAKSLSSSSSGPDNILAAFSSFFWPNVRRKQPLVFIHGSFHSAWCWAEHFLPFFAAQGYDSYAISCRGTSPSPSPNQEASITINTHAADLRDFLRVAFPPSEQDTPQPILIGHSFGGAILLKLLEQPTPSPLRGVAFLCSVPPSGNGPMTARFLKRDFILALKIVLGFVAKKGAEWDWLCQELFFSPSLPPDLLRKYKERLKKDSVVGIDVKNFLKELPVLRADGATGQGRWVNEVPSRLVIGAERDKLVDKEGVEETARFVDAEPPVFLPTAHDAMLDPEWRLAANALLQWLNAMDQAVKK
ncbi:hypothetical protein NSK_000915 [Nannochloropsis salina CCMP1776]|uniref:AB hydrolase-1 domain-containing protein n=1 Tax=Nannochloropsis salina CCMP1776 TaxID=1027361 RepID=A0A4D9D980_9STRA|nr:hypothetical protein NSK_000915 [Nannochloropsis salina CCMP1776]|eukprot:TFJ87564.1 hypothetical protein NSK_000915 [Nannochloropsis salina CCMP1776]